MSATFAIIALAVLVLPSSPARYRLRHWGSDSATGLVVRKPSSMVVLGVGLACVFVVCGPAAASAAGILAATLYRRHKRRVSISTRRTELASLASGLDVVIAEVRVGAHPADACMIAAAECGGDAALALRGAAARARLGGQAADGVEGTNSVIKAELTRLSAAWRVSDRYGLPLADLLAAAREDLLGRRRFAERTEAALAGARATGTVLAILPVLGIALGELMGAHPLATLFGNGVGGYLLMIGTALGCAGLVWTDAITQRVTS